MTNTFTEAQLKWITEQTARAVAKAQHQILRRALMGFLILAAGLLIAVGVSTYDSDQNRAAIVRSGRAVSVDGCNRDFKTQVKLRGSFTRALTAIDQQHKAGLLTGAQYDKAKSYYTTQLLTFKLPDCRKALNIVTDNPAQADKQAIPKPLYPGSPAAQQLEALSGG